MSKYKIVTQFGFSFTGLTFILGAFFNSIFILAILSVTYFVTFCFSIFSAKIPRAIGFALLAHSMILLLRIFSLVSGSQYDWTAIPLPLITITCLALSLIYTDELQSED